MSWKTGDNRDYAEIAKREKLKPIELELRKVRLHSTPSSFYNFSFLHPIDRRSCQFIKERVRVHEE